MVRENPNAKWASTAVVVRKPNGDFRMVVDLRKINSLCMGTTWPMPLLEGIIQHLPNSKTYLAEVCHELMSFMTD